MLDVHPSTSFTFLETLTIASFGANDWKLDDLVRLFELTPNLVRCTLPNIDVRTSRSDHDLPIVILPNLHSLEFGDSVVRDGLTTGNDLLRHLTLPALETLAVPLYVASFDDFSLFLRRSAPPLRSLLLGCGLYKIRFPQLHECLRLLPSLTHFDLCAPFAALDADLFAALVDSEFLLPNLQSLKIQSQALFHHSSLHQTVLQVLSARHPQLVCFHLCAKQHRPDTEILDGLRQLAADGMEIFIGKSWKKNYMSI
ncbi:hypothetical protein MSAN_00933100 [Mycena sanguinolenta]|uniref:Uncharacterized protein n=1 Tax=Mycena sanguinolenta TaxID=230812 RepID=A0A8H6YWZ3_9AGAR|nr:hypothetical protein MSAN_00933100 [Mycena sanguinolenta]